MKQEYIVISKTDIQQRIEDLEETFSYQAKHGHGELCHETNLQLTELRQVLSQSTPLIPIIEKVFDEGVFNGRNFWNDELLEKDKQDYISNLKLDI